MGIFDQRDTRTTNQKLEAMAAPGSGASEGERENAKHLLFKRRQRPVAPPKDDPDDTRNMSHADFMAYMKRKDEAPIYRKGQYKQPGIVTKPHRYEAYGGSDAMGCRSCGKSKDNKSAQHTKALG